MEIIHEIADSVLLNKNTEKFMKWHVITILSYEMVCNGNGVLTPPKQKYLQKLKAPFPQSQNFIPPLQPEVF